MQQFSCPRDGVYNIPIDVCATGLSHDSCVWGIDVFAKFDDQSRATRSQPQCQIETQVTLAEHSVIYFDWVNSKNNWCLITPTLLPGGCCKPVEKNCLATNPYWARNYGGEKFLTQAETPIPPDLAITGPGKPDLVDFSQNSKPCLDPVPHEDPGNFFNSPSPPEPNTQEDFLGSSGQQRQQKPLPILPNFQLTSSITDTQTGDGVTTPNFFNRPDSKDINIFGGSNNNDATIGQQPSFSDLTKLNGGNPFDATTGQQPSYSDLSKLFGSNHYDATTDQPTYGGTTDQPTPNSGRLPVDFSPMFRFKRRETYNYFHPGGL
ncbi:hypothetical protein MMC22_003924 [Lobaria immixta]|nr:hypothetical protein [Lobaria immixta]